jgi:5-methylcytosine-specific restriction endonuclease McrA
MAAANSIPIVTRAEAKASGLVRYFPGSTCKHGHVAERLTSNGSCLECCRLNTIAKYRADPAANLAKQRVVRQKPGYYERKLKKRHAADPALRSRVEMRKADGVARDLAQEAGGSMYESPRVCGKDGSYKRFTADGKCVECNRAACVARFGAKHPERIKAKVQKTKAVRERRQAEYAAKAPFRAASSARQTAIASGALTYIGRPCASGHDGTRYTKHGSCLQCAAAQASSEAKKAYDAAYLERNRARILERSRAYHAADPARAARQAKAWAQKNPEKRRAIADNYKHRRRAQEDVGMSSVEYMLWKKAQPKVCHWCGVKCEKRFEVDHYVALSKGGAHVASNLVIACRSCNARKHARDPLEFAQSVGRLF